MKFVCRICGLRQRGLSGFRICCKFMNIKKIACAVAYSSSLRTEAQCSRHLYLMEENDSHKKLRPKLGSE